MALDFLGDFKFEDLGKTLKTGLALKEAFTKRNIRDEIPFIQDMVDSAHASRVYASAAADPNSPYFKNLAALFDEKMRREAIEAIQRDIVMRRRASARGDIGAGINPERRDESKQRATALAFMAAKERAREDARASLQDASRSSAMAAYAYNPAASLHSRYGDIAANRRANAYGGLGETIQSLGAELDRVLRGGSSNVSAYAGHRQREASFEDDLARNNPLASATRSLNFNPFA